MNRLQGMLQARINGEQWRAQIHRLNQRIDRLANEKARVEEGSFDL